LHTIALEKRFMPLTATDTEPMRSQFIFGWAIMMQSENAKDVRILVTDEALRNVASPPDDSISRLIQYRSEIEAIASRKYDAKLIEPDGTVRVTSIVFAS
jgi:hypothetical protein